MIDTALKMSFSSDNYRGGNWLDPGGLSLLYS